jgi:predicted nucleic acid-binding protein
MRVYLDSMVWIYFLEGNPIFGPDANQLVAQLHAGGHVLLSSFLVEAEVLVLPKRNDDRFTAASYKRFFSSAGVVSIPYPPPSPDLYAELRAKHGTRPIDTLHATLAAAANADLLVTEDKKLLAATVPGVGRIVKISQANGII